jgi:hypothetical protein
MFSTNATAYFHNSVFQAKMALLLLAGLNMGIFELTTGRTLGSGIRRHLHRAQQKGRLSFR